MRKFVLYDLYRTRGLSLVEVALQLAAWQPNCQEQLPHEVESIEADLRALCLEYERDIRPVAGPELVERSFLRAARYILRMLTEGASIDQVAQFLRRYVVIVDISLLEQEYLDGSLARGGLGLKNSMPAGWNLQTGCIFQRLHDAGIEFDPPDGFAECTH